MREKRIAGFRPPPEWRKENNSRNIDHMFAPAHSTIKTDGFLRPADRCVAQKPICPKFDSIVSCCSSAVRSVPRRFIRHSHPRRSFTAATVRPGEWFSSRRSSDQRERAANESFSSDRQAPA